MQKDVMMIAALGSAGLIRSTDGSRADGIKRGAVPAKVSAESAATDVSNPVAEMVAEGPPVDTGKVKALRARIASGSYSVDADAIAKAMIATDLPVKN